MFLVWLKIMYSRTLPRWLPRHNVMLVFKMLVEVDFKRPLKVWNVP